MFPEAKPVRRNLKDVFKQRNSPADQDHNNERQTLTPLHILELEMAIPCQCHECIGSDEEEDCVEAAHVMETQNANIEHGTGNIDFRNSVLDTPWSIFAFKLFDQFLILNPVWRIVAESFLLVLFVFAEASFEPEYLRVTFESKNVRADAI